MKEDCLLYHIFGYDESIILNSSPFIVHVSGISADDTSNWTLSSLPFFNISLEEICLTCLEHAVVLSDD